MWIIKALLYKIFNDWRPELLLCIFGKHKNVPNIWGGIGNRNWKKGHYECERCGRKMIEIHLIYEE